MSKLSPLLRINSSRIKCQGKVFDAITCVDHPDLARDLVTEYKIQYLRLHPDDDPNGFSDDVSINLQRALVWGEFKLPPETYTDVILPKPASILPDTKGFAKRERQWGTIYLKEATE
jgi:hypothetical protein